MSRRPDTPPELREFQKKRLADIAERIEMHEHQKRMRLLEIATSSLTIKAKNTKQTCLATLDHLIRSNADVATIEAARLAYNNACIEVLICTNEEPNILLNSPK